MTPTIDVPDEAAWAAQIGAHTKAAADQAAIAAETAALARDAFRARVLADAPTFLDAIVAEWTRAATAYNQAIGRDVLGAFQDPRGGGGLRAIGDPQGDCLEVYPDYAEGRPGSGLRLAASLTGRRSLIPFEFVLEEGALQLRLYGELFDAPTAARRLAEPWLTAAR